MKAPRLPRSSRKRGSVWGVSLVRDELDVLPHTVAHLFDQGVDAVLIADNRSADGTREFLEELARADKRVHLALDTQPAHWQSEKMTWLAHVAWKAGADWVIPFDADEFWFAPAMSVADWLREQNASMIRAAFHHMVPAGVGHGELTDLDFYIDRSQSFPGKIAVRSHALLEIGPGNHFAARVGGIAYGLRIAHAQYRSSAQIARKVRQGTVSARLTGEDLSWFSPHWEKGSKLDDAEIRSVWENLTTGMSDERLAFVFRDPVLVPRLLSWKVWDPDGAIGT